MATSAEALSQLQQFQNTMANPLDLYNKQVSELGVGDVRGRVSNLSNTLLNTENALNQVEPSVTGRTQGSLVTEAQRQRLVNLERQPLASQYGKIASQYQNEQQNLRDLLGQASQVSSLGYQGEQQKLANLQNAYQTSLEGERYARQQQIEADQREWERQQALWQRQFAERQLAQQASLARASMASASRGISAEDRLSGAGQEALAALQFARQNPGQVTDYYRERVASALTAKYGISPETAGQIIGQVFPTGWEWQYNIRR